ncbi:MAG: hypothetical protein P4M13_08680 [Alphaproteobacteria bacterium]|nr:hypothetical protein [Alphaproteobacteria bacterium]
MFTDDISQLSPPLVQAIEDAILLGGAKEVGEVLELVREDEDFPDELRYGLEALHYFRLHYGKGGVLAPVGENERREMLKAESYWGRELLEVIARCPELGEARSA